MNTHEKNIPRYPVFIGVASCSFVNWIFRRSTERALRANQKQDRAAAGMSASGNPLMLGEPVFVTFV
jgi:hypothetical protein